MEAFFFGPPEDPLYGCLDLPEGGGKEPAVVIAPSWGEEYQRFHRALRHLARRLAATGLPTLRFDYFGTGDSAGENGSGGPEVWCRDLRAAIGEVRERVGSSAPAVVGLRLGGLLALEVAAREGCLPSLVLWDPVPSGEAFLRDLEAEHREMLRRAHVTDRPGSEPELLGYPLPPPLREGFRAARLPASVRGVERALLLVTHPRTDLEPVAALLRRGGAKVQVEQHPLPDTWRWLEDFGKVLVPAPVLNRIVHWLGNESP